MQKRTIKQIASRIPKERKKGWWKKWLVLIPVLFLVFGFVYFVNLPQYQINNVVVNGSVLTNQSELRSIALEELQGNYLLVIPKTFSWFYPKSQIKQKLESKSSIMEAVPVLDSSTQTLNISITERKQEYVWCEGTSDTKSECFYMDKDGLVFINAPEFEGHVFLTFYGLIDGSPVGKQYLDKSKMQNLLGFIDDIKKYNLTTVAVFAKSEREVDLKLSSGTSIIISLESDLKNVSKSIGTLNQSTEFLNASGGISKLNYLDLRYGSKAFWK